MNRDTIDDLERQLEEAKRIYLRSNGWDVTFKTPGAVPLWFRGLEGDRTVMVDLNVAVQMAVAAEHEPDADSSE